MLAVEPAEKVIEEQTAAVLTVTVIPLLIVTASEEVGTAEPPHVVVEFQFPLKLAVRAAALTFEAPNNANIRNANDIKLIKVFLNTEHWAQNTDL